LAFLGYSDAEQCPALLAAYLRGNAMITFHVVKEEHGWAIWMNDRMVTPFWSRDLAICEANRLAHAIRCHGEYTEVVVEEADPSQSLENSRLCRLKASSGARNASPR
jgi:hypothetical protein